MALIVILALHERTLLCDSVNNPNTFAVCHTTAILMASSSTSFTLASFSLANHQVSISSLKTINFLFHYGSHIFLQNWSYTRLVSLNLTIFIVNNFLLLYHKLLKNKLRYYFKSKMQNAIVNLKFLPTICFRYNSAKKSPKFLTLKMKLKRIDAGFPAQVYRLLWFN